MEIPIMTNCLKCKSEEMYCLNIPKKRVIWLWLVLAFLTILFLCLGEILLVLAAFLPGAKWVIGAVFVLYLLYTVFVIIFTFYNKKQRIKIVCKNCGYTKTKGLNKN